MPHALRAIAAAAAVLAAAAIPASAQATPGAARQPGAQQQPGLVADLLRDVAEVEKKLLDLARAMPPAAFDWRPGQGVRSTGEVFQHVAADNYFLGTPVGFAAPPATGIKGDDYKTVQAYETRKLARDEVIADLERSFAHLKQAMGRPGAMGDSVAMFGQKYTRRQLWILTTTHLHEHLGQLIAYARSNGVVPPWSR
jgi:uncharacterized damage-inducible protein DinB